MADYTWEPSTDSTVPTDYQLDKSLDGGLTWVALATVPHAIPGVDYDTATGRFNFTDGAPVVGEIVRIQAVDSGDSSRDSVFVFAHGAPATVETIHIFGQIIDSVSGVPRENVEIRVMVLSQEASTFLPQEGNAALPSNLGRPMLGHKYLTRVFTDDNGSWSVDTLKDLPLQVDIPETGYTMRFRTPIDRDLLNIVDASEYALSDRPGTQTPYEYGAGSGFVT